MCVCVFELSAQNRVKYCLVWKIFFSSLLSSPFDLVVYLFRNEQGTYSCLFGTVAPMSAACLSNSILLLLLGLVSLIPFYFLLSWLLMHFFVDVSVGVVVVCNLRFFFRSVGRYITQSRECAKGRRQKRKKKETTEIVELKRVCILCIERNTPTHTAHTCARHKFSAVKLCGKERQTPTDFLSTKRKRRKKSSILIWCRFFIMCRINRCL